jgi:hypothetical protein
MINKVKEAIVTMMSATTDAEDIQMLAMAYQALVNAETQEKLTEWQTRDCNCPQCRDGLDDEVIN